MGLKCAVAIYSYSLDTQTQTSEFIYSQAFSETRPYYVAQVGLELPISASQELSLQVCAYGAFAVREACSSQ